MSDKTLKDFIPDLPEHCGHRYRQGSNFCSVCGQKLPTQEEIGDVTYAIGFMALYRKN